MLRTTFNRRLSLLVALLFALITFVAERPHGHATTSKALSISASDGTVIDRSECQLCNWLTTSLIVPTVPEAEVFITSLPVQHQFIEQTVSLCKLVVPHRSLRAPPQYS